MFTLAANGDGRRESRREIAEKLYGTIELVAACPDYRVKFVESGADLRVKLVSAGANHPGRWKMVACGAAFRVKPVESGEDIRVVLVTGLEGPAN